MDHHVNVAITEGLRRQGIDVTTAYEDGAAQMDDPAILARTTQLGRVLFSQDKDLLVVAEQWLREGREFAGLVYAHQLAATIGQAIRDLTLSAQVLDPEDLWNRIQFIPL
jgi:hypothetical protein